MTDNVLEIRELSKDYGDFVLDRVSFALPRGVIMGLIGENGAGKSTTINCILMKHKKAMFKSSSLARIILQTKLRSRINLASYLMRPTSLTFSRQKKSENSCAAFTLLYFPGFSVRNNHSQPLRSHTGFQE